MARRPRPVDPDEGPLQAFAYDLRQLREKAGNPTYRVLARKAGYSPATLSEAARGQRRPSLDVTLAYVGACGGDADEWRLRWQDLAAIDTKTAVRTAAEPLVEPAEPAGVPAPAEPVPPPAPPRRGWTRPLLVAAAVVVVAVATGGVVLAKPWASPDKPRASGCPRAKAQAGTFTGQTYRYTRVREAPTLSAPVETSVPSGCTIVFSGYCLGDVVTDATSGTPDIRWFMLAGGGVMSSAVVHGNPPAKRGPSSCHGNLAAPSSIHMSVHRAGDGLRLRATGEGVRIVGFTSLDPGEGDGARWHQINGLIRSRTPEFDTRWRPAHGSGSSDRVTVAAVACLGGDGPTNVIDAWKIRRDGAPHAKRTTVPGAALQAATYSACQYSHK